MKKFKVITLGCKANSFESDSISMQLEEKGFKKGNLNVDIVVINTCTVTSKAGMQSRQEIRKAIKENPDAEIIVTGCHAEIASNEIKEISSDIKIVFQNKKNIIPEIISGIRPDKSQKIQEAIPATNINIREEKNFSFMPSGNFNNRTRAFLKIQDGCNAFCSYCIIPYARGRSRSMKFEDTINELKLLKEKNYKEVVLTGIHIGCYGEDLEERKSLTDLIKTAAKNPSEFPRLRISSIEPGEITDEIIEIASDNSILCPHFHIPFQNGDDEILKKMNRPYKGKFIYDLVEKICKKVDNVCIGGDIILGFPGEKENSFLNSYNMMKDMDIAYLHVFPFSPRKNTPAATFSDQVDGTVVKKRTKKMRNLSKEKTEAFLKSQSGRTLNVLLEKGRDKKNHMLKGFSENYVQCFLDAGDELKNKIVRLKTTYDKDKKIMIGKVDS